MSTPITATGIQGFLLWYQREQPGIFAKIAPQLPAIVPKAFSNYNAKLGTLFRKFSADRPGLGRLGAAVLFRKFMADRPGLGAYSPSLALQLSGLSGSVQFRKSFADRPGLGSMEAQRNVAAILNRPPFYKLRPHVSGLGDTEGDISYDSDYSDASYQAPPVSIDLTTALNQPIDVGEINTGDAPDLNVPGTGASGYPYSSGSPVAMAANTGVSSTPTASAIGQVIGAASAVYMTSQQAALQNSLVQTNLQRAAAGLPPLNTSLSAAGVPIVTTAGTLGSSGTLILLGIAAAIALALSSGGSKSL